MPGFMEKYGDRFTCEELTEGINNIDSGFGTIINSGLFEGKGVRTTDISIEYSEGRLTVLADRERGSETVYQKKRNRKLVSFHIPFFPYSAPIKAADIQDVRAFGKTDELESIDSAITEYQDDAKYNHDITLEFMQIGALLGQIRDGEGNLLEDLYSKFGVSQPTESFSWANQTFDPSAAARSILRKIKSGMKGDIHTGVKAYCSATFWDNLMKNAAFKAAYQVYLNINPIRDDVRAGFKYAGIIWEEYNVEASASNGASLDFIPDGQAIFFPIGSKKTFRYFKAPGDFIEATNTIGIDIYSKIWERNDGRGLVLETQSARLPINMRPLSVVKGISG